MAELATAWVSLRVSTQGMRGDVNKALQGVEADATKTGQSMGSRISSGLGTALKRTAVGAGVAGGAALAAGLTKGVGRLNSIEQAEAKLTGLGNSASDVGSIMDNALTSVRGTSYGLEEAATIAASAVAAGVSPGAELERTLTLTGDAAAIAGVELGNMGSIVNKVATSDMMQMDVANQLMDAGIPILQMVGEEMGVTAEEARKMASAGEVSFETFQNALEQGVGGAALEMGDTTEGAFRNMGAAAGRLGATLAGPFFDQSAGAFTGITGLLDDLNDAAGPAMDDLAGWLEDAGASAADAFAQFRESETVRDVMSDLGDIFKTFGGLAADVWPSLQKIAGALGEASAALGVSAWDTFVVALGAGATVLESLTGPLELVAGVMEAQPGLVTAAVGAWMAFRTVPTVMGGVTTAVDLMRSKVAPAVTGIRDFGGAWRDSMTYAAQGNPHLGTAGQAVKVMGENARGAVRGGISALSNALGGPLNIGLMAAAAGLMALSAHSQAAEQHQDALRAASERLAESQDEVAAALAEANGELSSEVWAELASQIDSTRDSMDELGDAGPGLWAQLGAGIKAGGQLVAQNVLLTDAIAGSAAETVDSTYAMNESAASSKEAAEAIADLGLTNEEVAARVYGSQGAWDSLRSSLEASGEGGGEAAAQLGRLREEFEQQQEAIDALPDGAYELAGAIETIGDEASSASDKVAAMQAALDALSGGKISAEEAAFNYAETLRDVADGAVEAADASGGLGDDLIGANDRLDESQANSGLLRDELKGMSEDFLGAAIASGDATAEYDKAIPALDALAEKYKLTEGQVRELAGQYGMVPDQVQTMITVANDEVAKGQVKNVLTELNGIPPGTTARVFVNNDQARSALEATGVEIVNYDAKTGEADVRVDNEQALDGTNQAWGQVTDFGTVKETATVDVENSGVDQGVRESKGWLDSIPLLREVTVRFKAMYDGFRDRVGLGGNATGGAWDGAQALRRFATGGHSGYRLPTTGLGTGETDGFLAFNSQGIPAARLDAGEWIINGRSSEKYNRELAAINAGVFPKLPGYANGGLSGSELDRKARDIEGATYSFGGWGNGWNTDCTGAAAILANLALVGDMFTLGRFATGNASDWLRQSGFVRERWSEGSLGIGYTNDPGGPGGGHAATTLPHGVNVEMGGGRGNGQYGGNAAGANDPQFRNQWSLPMFSWGYSGMEGAEGLMPPGDSSWGGMAGGATRPGLYSSPGNSGQVGADQPRTWSDMAAGAVSALVGGQVSDTLGVFGIPDQLPPIVQAWQMLNERPGGGPSDWDLSTAAAEVKRLDAAIKIREQVTGEAAKALDAMNGNGVGNALPAAVTSAEAELDKQLLDLESDRLAYERAQSKLEGLLGSRAAALATDDLTGASDAMSLSDALAPDTSFPDELMRELKVAYDPAGGAEQWRPMVAEALKRNGFAATQREQDLMISQIRSESGGDPNILQQVQDVNSGGNEAQGLLQVIPGTFAAHRDPELPNDRTDPWANMNAALRYYKSRYGMDLGAMWGKGHGYNLGGWINGSGTGDTVPLVGAPGEFIVNRRAAAENRDELEAMNSGRSSGASSRGSVTYNIHTFDLDEAMRELNRRESQHAQTHLGARV